MAVKMGQVIPFPSGQASVTQPLDVVASGAKKTKPRFPQQTIPLDYSQKEVIEATSYSPSGQRLAYGTNLNRVGLWDVTAGCELASQSLDKEPEGILSSLRLTDKELLIGTHTGQVLATDSNLSQSPEKIRQFQEDPNMYPQNNVMAISPDGRFAIASHFKETWVYDREQERSFLESLAIQRGHAFYQNRFYFGLAQGNAYAPAVYGYDLEQGHNASRGKKQFEVFGHSTAMTVSSDGRFLAVATLNGSLSVWNTSNGNLATSVKIYQEAAGAGKRDWARPLFISAVAFLPDNKGLIVALYNGMVEILRIDENNKELKLVGRHQFALPIRKLEVSPQQNSLLLSAADYGIRLPQHDDDSEVSMAEIWQMSSFVNLAQSLIK